MVHCPQFPDSAHFGHLIYLAQQCYLLIKAIGMLFVK